MMRFRSFAVSFFLSMAWAWPLGAQEAEAVRKLEIIRDVNRHAHNLLKNVDLKVRFYQYVPEAVEKKAADANSSYRIFRLSEHRIEESRYVYDRTGRKRIESQFYDVTPLSDEVPFGNKITRTWDLEKCMTGETSEDRLRVTLSSEDSVNVIRTPEAYTHVQGKPVHEFLDELLHEGRSFSLAAQDDDLWVLSVQAGEESGNDTLRLQFDGTKGFSLTRCEHFADGRLASVTSCTLARVSDAVWFPVAGEDYYYDYSSGRQVVTFSERMDVKEVRVNQDSTRPCSSKLRVRPRQDCIRTRRSWRSSPPAAPPRQRRHRLFPTRRRSRPIESTRGRTLALTHSVRSRCSGWRPS